MKLTDILEWENEELFEMANIHSNLHDIDGVVIWVGLANKRHGLRVKISNIKDKFAVDNHFTIQMPSLDYDIAQVASWIKPSVPKILEWIKLNQPLLYAYECGEISDTSEFLKQIVKV